VHVCVVTQDNISYICIITAVRFFMLPFLYASMYDYINELIHKYLFIFWECKCTGIHILWLVTKENYRYRK